MYLRVYDSRDSSHQSSPQVLWFLERLVSPIVSCCVTTVTRTRLTVCLPSVYEVFQMPLFLQFQRLVSHYTDTHLYIFSLAITLPLVINISDK